MRRRFFEFVEDHLLLCWFLSALSVIVACTVAVAFLK